jgi:Ca-activated chloride channel family protein
MLQIRGKLYEDRLCNAFSAGGKDGGGKTMTFYSPKAFIFLLVIPAIIVLYLLKQKHLEHTVSSIYLWREVIRDIEANAPWQRLKRNILMILEIAAVVFLVFALSNPFLDEAGGKPQSVVVAIDTSMSMQAADIKPSRFDAAKKKASEYISSLKPGTVVTLVSIGTDTFIEENISSDKSRLLKKLSDIKVTNGRADYDDAVNLISSILRQNPDTRVALFTDEAFTISGAKPDFFLMNGGGDNYAVTLLSHTRTQNGITALSRIANYGSQDAVIPLSLYVDGRVFDAKNADVKKGETKSIYWADIPEDALTVELRIDAKDSLDADNAAWNAVNPSRIAKILLAGKKNIFIEKILSLTGCLEFYKSSSEDIGEMKGYDLYIFNGELPESLPEDGNIMIFDPKPNEYFEIGEEIKLPNLRKPGHEFFKHVDNFPFVIGKTKILEMPLWAKEVISADEGVVAFSGQPDRRKFAVFGFDLNYSDFPLTEAFPIVMTEALGWLLPQHIENVENALPGQSIEFNLDPKVEKARVIAPSGRILEIAPPFPVKVFSETDEIGIYTLEQKGEGVDMYYYFCINAPAGEESNLSAVKDKTDTAVSFPAAAEKKTGTGFKLKAILLWTALIILLIEWWVYTNGI